MCEDQWESAHCGTYQLKLAGVASLEGHGLLWDEDRHIHTMPDLEMHKPQRTGWAVISVLQTPIMT